MSSAATSTGASRAAGTLQRRGRFVPRMRTNLVAAALTVGLVLTSGVGVVLADEWFGGGGNTYDGTQLLQ